MDVTAILPGPPAGAPDPADAAAEVDPTVAAAFGQVLAAMVVAAPAVSATEAPIDAGAETGPATATALGVAEPAGDAPDPTSRRVGAGAREVAPHAPGTPHPGPTVQHPAALAGRPDPVAAHRATPAVPATPATPAEAGARASAVPAVPATPATPASRSAAARATAGDASSAPSPDSPLPDPSPAVADAATPPLATRADDIPLVDAGGPEVVVEPLDVGAAPASVGAEAVAGLTAPARVDRPSAPPTTIDPVEGLPSPAEVAAAAPLPADAETTASAARAVERALAAQVAERVGRLATGPDGDYELSIDLEPAELGRLELRVRLEAGVVHVQVEAGSRGTSDLLRDGLAELRDALADAGLTPGSLDVRDQQLSDRPETGRAHDDRRDGRDVPVRRPVTTPAAPHLTVPTRAAAPGRVDVLL